MFIDYTILSLGWSLTVYKAYMVYTMIGGLMHS